MSNLLTKAELAEELKVSIYAIDRYREKGFKPYYLKPLRFRLEDFVKWNDELKRKEASNEKTN